MLNRDPLIGREGLDRPVAVEPADPGILLAAERAVGQVDDRLIVDVRRMALARTGLRNAGAKWADEEAVTDQGSRVVGLTTSWRSTRNDRPVQPGNGGRAGCDPLSRAVLRLVGGRGSADHRIERTANETDNAGAFNAIARSGFIGCCVG
jgi:hypothetical protein